MWEYILLAVYKWSPILVLKSVTPTKYKLTNDLKKFTRLLLIILAWQGLKLYILRENR